MRTLTLKVAATVVTAAAAIASAAHVGGHVKSASAPLHPGVVGSASAPGLALTPSVRTGEGVQPVTSTYVS